MNVCQTVSFNPQSLLYTRYGQCSVQLLQCCDAFPSYYHNFTVAKLLLVPLIEKDLCFSRELFPSSSLCYTPLVTLLQLSVCT